MAVFIVLWSCLFTTKLRSVIRHNLGHSRVACWWSKMPMFQRTGMRDGRLPLPPAFQHLILMTWRACDLDLVMVSLLPLKWQGLKVGMFVFQLFYEMKLKTSKSKVLAFWGQWSYYDKIQITSSSCHKNQILKS